MGLSPADRQRLQELAQEVKEILGAGAPSDEQPRSFAALEDECIDAGDFLTAALLQQRIVDRAAVESSHCCPTCGRLGEPGPDEPRVLQTDRGEVSWMEPSCECRHCRRSFFP